MATFAENEIVYPDTQSNVEAPPATLMQNGFIPKQSGTRGQPLAANWLNWLFRQLFRAANRDRISDGNGVDVLSATDDNSIITLHAVQKTDPTKFIHAVGFKSGAGAPVFRTLSNATLTLGTATATNVPIAGVAAADVIMHLHVQKA